MRAMLKPLIALFISCFVLFLGNGLANVLLPVRMNLDGVDTDAIGLVLSLYFVGMLAGAIYSKSLIKRAGHIRMFSACVALAAIAILLCSIVADVVFWGAMRIIMGFCNACALAAMESWLTASSTRETRGKVLAVYNAMILAGLFGGQFFMNIANPSDTTLFVMGGILFCLAIMPVSLSRNPGPEITEVKPMSLPVLYRVSPVGVICCFVSGMIYAALFNLLPVFAESYGITEFKLSLFVGAAIIGAFILQFPVGYLSDRFDRRVTLTVLLILSALASVVVILLAEAQQFWSMALVTALVSGIIACAYPISVSQVFDQLDQDQMIAAMGSLIVAFSVGGILGPYTASLIMSQSGPAALFYFLSGAQVLTAVFVIYRMTIREALPVDEQESFVMQNAAMSPTTNLDPRTRFIKLPRRKS